jgi:hypothetical protein
LTNFRQGLGSFVFSLNKLDTDIGGAEGIRVETQVIKVNERINIVVKDSIKKMHGSDKVFSDLVIEMAVNGLNGKSIEDLIALQAMSCNFSNLTFKEKNEMRASIRTLLFEGFEAGIQKISGSVDGARLDGKLMFALNKTKGEEFKFENVLSSNGVISLSGKDIKPADKKTLLDFGFKAAPPDVLKADYNYSSNMLKVNGKPMDVSFADFILISLSKSINDFLAGREQVVEIDANDD